MLQVSGEVVGLDTMPPLIAEVATGRRHSTTGPYYFPQTAKTQRIEAPTFTAATPTTLAARIELVFGDSTPWIKAPFLWPEWSATKALYQGNSTFPFRYLDIENGLLSNGVNSFLEDREGKIWMGTDRGISVWDGAGFMHFTEEIGLKTGSIKELLADAEGRIWIAHRGGIDIWDGTNFLRFKDEKWTNVPSVNSLLQDRAGNVWLGTGEGLFRWGEGGMHHYRFPEAVDLRSVSALNEDENGVIWIASNQGLLSLEGDRFTHYAADAPLDLNQINTLTVDNEGYIWIAARGAGISVFNAKGDPGYYRFQNLFTPDRTRKEVNSVYADREGNVWIGTFGSGAILWQGSMDTPETATVTTYTSTEGLSHNVVYCFLEDSGGQVWFGTESGVTLWDKNGYRRYSPYAKTSNSDVTYSTSDHEGRLWSGFFGGGLGIWGEDGCWQYTRERGGIISDRVICLMEDTRQNMWIGTSNGLSVWDGEIMTNYPNIEGLGERNIDQIIEGRDGSVYLATTRGLFKVDPVDMSFARLSPRNGLISGVVHTVLEDKQGNIWMGTSRGLSIWKDQQLINYPFDEDWIGSDIWKMILDRKGNIWMATSGQGLIVIEAPKGELTNLRMHKYTVKEGLSDNVVLSLLNPSAGKVLVGSMKGLHEVLNWAPSEPLKIRTPRHSDGLLGIRIQHLFQDRENYLWVGTNKGLNRIVTGNLAPDTSQPKLALREVQAFFEESDWRSKGRQKKTKPIQTLNDYSYDLSDITYDSVIAYRNLPYQPAFPNELNYLSFRWQGIDPTGQSEIQFSYVLEGKDFSWSPPQMVNQVTYQDIGPGAYTFKVRAVGASGRWSDTASYDFIIQSAWWQTSWAYLLYFLLLIGSGALLYRFLQWRWSLESALIREQEEAMRLKELDIFKSRLYTNLTHEFRTPLTVILGMTDQLEKQPKKQFAKGVELIRRNGTQLLQLINQLLDLSKLENKAFQLELQRGDIIPYLSYLAESFQSLANDHNHAIRFQANKEHLVMDFDPESLKQVMTNLISNAIKFTPSGGEIKVRVNASEDQTLLIQVIDNGIGISKEVQVAIFDRFYQVDNSLTRRVEGTGIGLAHARELVGVMGGTIELESTLGKGSCFEVRLPIRQEAPLTREPLYGQIALESSHDLSTEIASPKRPMDDNRPLILVIEDNADVVTYLKSCLEPDYDLDVAYNGSFGIKKALQNIPDLIICDVMMPGKSGFEVCQTLKNDERSSHIPIVLLTARADAASRLEGLGVGADAYLAKPFVKEELDIRLEQLMALRHTLQLKYARLVVSSTHPENDDSPPTPETSFLLKLNQIIQEHMEDPGFSNAQLASRMQLSQSQLFRKIKALTGKSTAIYIRSLRLHKAKKLLETTNLNVSEIGYMVGFNDPSYFSRSFQKEFGVPPSAIERH